MTRLIFVLAAALSLRAAVPTPESHFGHAMGADRKLISWSQTVAYFRGLPAQSDRILVRDIGRTTEGRPMIAAFISAPENLKQLARFQQNQKRLADPRTTSPEEAARIVAGHKAIVMITCSIHSTEVASTHTAVQFAYRMLTEQNGKFAAVLKDVIFILVPSLNPDGVDIVKNWYDRTLGTPHEGTSPPQLYQKYVGHDNNRDWYIFSQPETRNVVTQLHNVWHPQIVYDVHQQGPYASRMFIPPWLDPIDPNVDPILAQSANMVGTGMAYDLTAAGRKGVVINAIYDFWTPARHYQAYHGGMRILSESASVRLATPITVRPDQINENANGYLPRQRSWNYLEPWLGGEWHLADIVRDQSIAWESCLFQAATRREDLLRNFYTINRNAATRTSPNAFVISAKQRDLGLTRKLLETLAFGAVEIEKAGDAFQAAGVTYPAGSYIIRMQQPFGGFAKTLLERQQYPDLRLYPGGPPRRPYDVTAQTLPLLMGVDVASVDVPFEGKGSRVTTFNDLPAVNQWFHFPGGRKPRVAIYKSHMPQMDEGWTRWMFEQLGIAYTSLGNAEILAGDLHAKYDTIVFPDQSPASIHAGYGRSSMPEEFTGGLGEKGAGVLKAFAEAGGSLVFLNDSCDYAIERLAVPVRNAVHGLSSREYYVPGSLLNVRLAAGHRLARGLPEELAIWNEASPVFQIPQDAPVSSVASYPASGLLASGWLLGERHAANLHALVEVRQGKGKVILFGMRPQYRAQSYQTMKLLFNALIP
jgi:hypothetical protein